MINAEELLKITKAKSKNPFRLGTVQENNKIKFDGTKAVSQKSYKKLNNIELKEGDRVLLARISGTFVILGKLT